MNLDSLNESLVSQPIVATSLDNLVLKSGRKLQNIGHVGSSGQMQSGTKELVGAKLILTNPQNRWMINPFRKHSIYAQIAETIWVLSGNNDIEWLSKFLPRAQDFSDDTITWRAGYGTRIFAATGIDSNNQPAQSNQMDYVISTLKDKLDSRQAVITIWDALKENTVGTSKDFPCNDLLHFLVRDDKLHMFVTVRSNDLIWGFSGINVVEFSIMQEVLASILGVDVGYYYHHSNSLHYYNYHEDRMVDILKFSEYESDVDLSKYRYVVESFDPFKELYRIELLLRNPSTETEGAYLLDEFMNSSRHNKQFKYTFTLPIFRNRTVLDALKPSESELKEYLHPDLFRNYVGLK